MEYLEKLGTYIEESVFYENFLSQLPAPLNNSAFDSLLLVVIAVLLIRRAIEAVRLFFRRKKMRTRQEEIRRKNEEDTWLRKEEADIQKGKLNAFLRFMEAQARPRSQKQEASQSAQGIGANDFRIADTHSASDFEILMEEAEGGDDE